MVEKYQQTQRCFTCAGDYVDEPAGLEAEFQKITISRCMCERHTLREILFIFKFPLKLY